MARSTLFPNPINKRHPIFEPFFPFGSTGNNLKTSHPLIKSNKLNSMIFLYTLRTSSENRPPSFRHRNSEVDIPTQRQEEIVMWVHSATAYCYQRYCYFWPENFRSFSFHSSARSLL
jgi:hypothetical protein